MSCESAVHLRPVSLGSVHLGLLEGPPFAGVNLGSAAVV